MKLATLLIFLVSPLWAAEKKTDIGAIGLAFEDNRMEHSHFVNDSSTQHIRGVKYFANNVMPESDSAVNLGASGTEFLAAYVDTVTVHSVVFPNAPSDPPAANALQQKGFFNVVAGVNANCTESWSVNVESYTVVGTGQCRVNFDRNFTNTSYACFVTLLDAANVRLWKVNDTNITAGGVEVIIYDSGGTARDEPFWIGCVGAQ